MPPQPGMIMQKVSFCLLWGIRLKSSQTKKQVFSYFKFIQKWPSVINNLTSHHQAIIYSNQTTFGCEIILLTDGEDNGISSCFEEIKQSGAIIHTIALGPAAAKELETLSTMTGKALEHSFNRK
jgi:hypothetical protein